MSHSVLFAIIASVIIALLLSKAASISFGPGFSISLFSILLHDLLDLAQSTDRLPLWPVTNRQIGIHIIPTDPFLELLLFGSIFVSFLMTRYLIIRSRMKGENDLSEPRIPVRLVWFGRIVIIVIMLSAAGTHYLRDVREHQLNDARFFLKQKDYLGILKKTGQAKRWPSTAKPGRIDYLKALAYEGLGNRQQAEQYYLRSYRADPGYFWCVVDLAMFYATAPVPVPERRRLIAPYLKRLQSEFSGRKKLAGYLRKIERKLAGKKAL